MRILYSIERVEGNVIYDKKDWVNCRETAYEFLVGEYRELVTNASTRELPQVVAKLNELLSLAYTNMSLSTYNKWLNELGFTIKQHRGQ